MSATTDTVADRIETARATVTPIQVATILVFGTAITFMLVFLQEPLVHDSMHNFRHVAGITCH